MKPPVSVRMLHWIPGQLNELYGFAMWLMYNESIMHWLDAPLSNRALWRDNRANVTLTIECNIKNSASISLEPDTIVFVF